MIEKELLAVIFCLEKFRTFVQASKLIIRTDHQALTFLKRCRLLSERLTRWVLFLQQFEHSIEHIKGTDNKVPDILSRYPVGFDSRNGREIQGPLIAAFSVEGLEELKREFKNLVIKQREDITLSAIRPAIEKPEETHPQTILRIIKQYELRDEWLLHRDQHRAFYTCTTAMSRQENHPSTSSRTRRLWCR